MELALIGAAVVVALAAWFGLAWLKERHERMIYMGSMTPVDRDAFLRGYGLINKDWRAHRKAHANWKRFEAERSRVRGLAAGL